MAKRRTRRETSSGGVVYRRMAEGPRFLLILDVHGNWGFPKGHVEPEEQPLAAATREIAEETGIEDLILRGELEVVDWYFRARRVLIHKYCHLFLFESPGDAVRPQLDEGITECCWYDFDSALQALAYENSRSALRKAGDLVEAMVREEVVVRDR